MPPSEDPKNTTETVTLEQVSKDLKEHVGKRFDTLEERVKAAEDAAQANLELVQRVADESKAKAGLPGYDPNATDIPEKQFSLGRALRGWDNGWTDGTKQSLEYTLCHEYANHLRDSGQLNSLQRDGQVSGFGAGGGLLISTQMSPTIAAELESNSVLLKGGAEDLSGLTGGPFRFMREEGGLIVHWPGEGGAGDESEQAFSALTLNPHKAIIHSLVSREQMVQDGGKAMNLTERSMGRKFGLARDMEAFTGDGQGKPKGILSAQGIGQVDFSDIDFDGADQNADDKLEQMVEQLKSNDGYYGYGEVKYVSNPKGFSTIRKTKDADGRRIELFTMLAGDAAEGVSVQDRLYGHRYLETTLLPDGTLLLAAMKAILSASWDTIEITRSPVAPKAWQSGDLAVRAVMLVDSNVIRGEHLQTATNWSI